MDDFTQTFAIVAIAVLFVLYQIFYHVFYVSENISDANDQAQRYRDDLFLVTYEQLLYLNEAREKLGLQPLATRERKKHWFEDTHYYVPEFKSDIDKAYEKQHAREMMEVYGYRSDDV